MVVADLHVHTRNSDGQLRLADVPGAAREAGVDVVAITDHDRLHPDIAAPVTEREGAVLVRGIELRVETPTQRVDLLGYGATRSDPLSDEIERIQRDRLTRGRAIIERVEEYLGHSIPVEPARGLGRPDIARAVVESDPDYDDIGDAFEGLIGEGDPCYVPRDVPSFERGREVLSDGCALVSLAHPLRYPDPEAALELTPELDGVEVHYPYDGARGHGTAEGPLGVADVRAVADEHDLVVTGGSDAHRERLGKRTLEAEAFEQFRDALAADVDWPT